MVLTIQDIARIAGVSKSTVSRYLNGGSVSKKTHQKLEEIIEQYQYTPSPFAQSLKAKTSNIIGVIIPRLDSSAVALTLKGIDQTAQQLGYQLLIFNTNQTPNQEEVAIQQFAKDKVAGILFMATEVNERYEQLIHQMNVKGVVIGQPYPNVHSVVHHDYKAGRELAKAIVEKGHTNIAYIGVSERDYSVGVLRKKGVLDELKEQGIERVALYESDFSIQKAIKVGLDILNETDSSIVIAASDTMAIGAMKAAYMKGISVPEGLSVAGFGGYDMGQYVHPALSTVQYQYEQAGKTSMETLHRLLQGEECPFIQYIETTVELRDSVSQQKEG